MKVILEVRKNGKVSWELREDANKKEMALVLAAAAAAKSLQSCPTLCDPIDDSPPGSPVHGIFQARVLEWGAIAFSGHWYLKGHKTIN